ncbi:MAG: carbohydrate binding domain-containing protein, partial [Oscillospiraceae bacterium]|nr:carbohydrate binding domain-containing protein [Oscillospiraceae bacterium]
MKKYIRRSAAAVLALSMIAAAIPIVQASAEVAEESKVIYETDFEDGDVSRFSKRGDSDTSVIGTATAPDAPSGSTVMTVSERSQGWNGPQFRLDEICEPGVKYMLSVKVKAAWYNNIMVSMQSTANGTTEASYANLGSAVSEGGWVSLEDVTFTFSEDVHDVYIYIESGDGTDLSVDDFCLKTAPVYDIESDIPGLKDVYADYFKIGGAVTAEELAPSTTKDLILKHYNSITLGNELKPENMLDQAACQAYAARGDNT